MNNYIKSCTYFTDHNFIISVEKRTWWLSKEGIPSHQKFLFCTISEALITYAGIYHMMIKMRSMTKC